MGICEDMLSLLTTETNKFIGDMPDIPDSLSVIYATGGFDQELQLNKSVVNRDTFMIKVRDNSYAMGNMRCEEIKETLNTITNTKVNNNYYIEIFIVGGINHLGKDNRERHIFSMNFKTRNLKTDLAFNNILESLETCGTFETGEDCEL